MAMNRLSLIVLCLLTWLSLAASTFAEDALPDTLFLTWSGDPTTTMDVQWLEEKPPEVKADANAPGDAAAEADDTGHDDQRLTYLKADGDAPAPFAKVSEVEVPDSGYVLHVARLTDLEPDTRYRATLDGAAFEFLTAPAKLDRSVVFAEGGDIGTGPDVPALHKVAASWDPLFGSVGGDIAYADGVKFDEWLKFLRTWHKEMRTEVGRLIPLVAAIGNHEVRGGFGEDPKEAPFFHALFGRLYPEHPYGVLDFGDYLSILLLDSGHCTAVAGDQTDWLDEALAQRKGRTHVLPTYHVSAYPSLPNERGGPRMSIGKDIRDHWVGLFEKYHVRTVFEHDDHVYKRTHPLIAGKPVEENMGESRSLSGEVLNESVRGVVYIGDGAWGRSSRKVEKKDRPYLAVAEAKMYVLRVELMPNGEQRFTAYHEKGEKVDEVKRGPMLISTW